MRIFFSRTLSSRRTVPTPLSEKIFSETRPLNDDDGPSADGDSTTLATPTIPLPPNLKIKRVDNYWSSWSDSWKYRNTGSGVVAENVRAVGNGPSNDPWQNFCFVVVRKVPRRNEEEEITYKIVIKSLYLRAACKDVIQQVPGISWTADPLELDPQILLAFFPQLENYEKQLRTKTRSTQDDYVLASLGVLLEYLRKDYRATLAKIANLTAHGEITSDLLYAILVPRTLIITECPVTGETRALELCAAKPIYAGKSPIAYRLLCESVDSLEEAVHGRSAGNAAETPQHIPPLPGRATFKPKSKTFGRVQSVIYIEMFSGTKKINTLAAYPLKYSRDPDGLNEMMLERSKKWASLRGVHHLHYAGTAAFRVDLLSSQKVVKYNVDSRIVIDRRNFLRLHPNYARPKSVDKDREIPDPSAHDMYHPDYHFGRTQTAQDDFQEDCNIFKLDVHNKMHSEETPLKDEDLLLASPILYGYSLTDKIWLEFNVQHVQPIVWNEEAFDNLVLEADRKHMLRSLVDAHSDDLGFDDFVQGKGQGLIINLFGPPGVGKTLSAEATSERVHRPLYVVGGGDLGTKAADVDAELTRVFDIATSWKAIVLIDEADVFLERRSLHDLERNAMVAVFLRHVEYYRGILFLTTNRITAFDPAFLSRIHVALHFGELTVSARAQVWRAFLLKAGVASSSSPEEAGADALAYRLAVRAVNGRQIKNACRTAQSLAHSRGERLAVEHLEETLGAMEDFNAEFAAMTKGQHLTSP
ncbi:P-loop containing nucleoside triphosphate hydrolase protein [Trametes elegans]|nr:P-loop containing nucleoside triphosphate hydrolase protein [Trametes elegans]